MKTINKGKDSISLRSQEMLTEIYNMRLTSRNRRHHRDSDGRPIWSYDHFEMIFTYYLYNTEGETIEIGDGYIPQIVLAQIIGLTPLPASEITYFIVNHHIAYNITRLEALPPAVVPMPVQPTQTDLLTVSITIDHNCEKPQADSVIPLPACVLPIHQPAMAPQRTIEVPTEAQPLVIKDTLFADRVLAEIFSTPVITQQILISGIVTRIHTTAHAYNAPAYTIIRYPSRRRPGIVEILPAPSVGFRAHNTS